MEELVFTSDYLRNNFEEICDHVWSSADTYVGFDFHDDYFKIPFRAGLKAGDNGRVRRLRIEDVENIAETFGYSEDDQVAFLAFKFGFATALHEDMFAAAEEVLEIDDYTDDLERIVSHRQEYGEEVTAEEYIVRDVLPGAEDVVIVAASYTE